MLPRRKRDQVIFDDKASGFAQVIVRACGEDSDVVTFDRMNEIDAKGRI